MSAPDAAAARLPAPNSGAGPLSRPGGCRRPPGRSPRSNRPAGPPELIGVEIGRQTGEGTARVSARIDGHLAMIEMRLSLAYPAPVRALTREVRLARN